MRQTIMIRILSALMLGCLLLGCITLSVGAEDEHELRNVALNQYIEASSSYHAPEGFFNETFLVDGEWLPYADGNIKMGWNTDTTGSPVLEDTEVDITVFFDYVCKIRQIVLKPMKFRKGDTFPRDYTLQVSADGIDWIDVASDKDVNAVASSDTAVKPLTYDIEPIACRYFRIHITKHSAHKDPGGSYVSAIGELELWGYECDESELPTVIKTYTATFIAGSQVVAKVQFQTGTTSLEEPPVPEVEGYRGEWQAYTMKNGNMTIKAVYTEVHETVAATEASTESLETEAPTEMETEAPTAVPTEAETEAATERQTETEDNTEQGTASNCTSAVSSGILLFVCPVACILSRKKKH